MFLAIIGMSLSSCSSDDAPQAPPVTVPTTGSVSGFVQAEGVVVNGAVVTLKQDGQTDKTVTTGADGIFKFTTIPTGKISLVAAYANYITKTTPAVVSGGQDLQVTINISADESKVTAIPDAAFEKKLIDMGLDSGPINGSVPTYKISSVKNLSLNDSGIADVTGLQDFTALESFSCSNLYGSSVIKLKSIDISKNTALKSLNLATNEITTLDISKNLALESIDISGNSISTLDVTKHTNLKMLSCGDNKITTLDLSNNAALQDLYVSQLALTSIDVSKNPALRYFYINAVGLNTIDVSKNPALEVLYCIENNFQTIDVSNNSILRVLNIDKNKLTSLDLTKNAALTTVSCGRNEITSIDVTKCSELTTLVCNNNLLLNLDVSQNTKLLNLSCAYNVLGTLDCSKNPLLATKDGYYLICNNNVLTKLNLKSGNNKNFKGGNFLNNTSMLQIAVDDVAYSNEKWKDHKDPAATFVSSF